MQTQLPLTKSTDAALAEAVTNRLDRRAIEDIRMLQTPGSENLVVKLIRIYLARTEELLRQLRQAAAVADARAFHRAAHSLKSNSRVIGALKVAQLARQMESLSASGGLERTEHDVVELAREVDLVHQLLVETLRTEDCGRGISPLN
jgi:HPt (histidine-containing phosphotransfer) domain-containing protein